jgi:EamA domain-containing membrane protein RarD
VELVAVLVRVVVVVLVDFVHLRELPVVAVQLNLKFLAFHLHRTQSQSEPAVLVVQ